MMVVVVMLDMWDETVKFVVGFVFGFFGKTIGTYWYPMFFGNPNFKFVLHRSRGIC